MKSHAALRAGLFSTLVVGALLALGGCGGGGGASGSAADPGGGSGGGSGGGGSGQASYRILATNDLGMHCVDADFSVFSILPPYNVVNAQVVRTDGTGKPSLMDDLNVVLRYSAIADANGSINSHSSDNTNFWQYVLLPVSPGQVHAVPARRHDQRGDLPELSRRHEPGRRDHGARDGRQH